MGLGGGYVSLTVRDRPERVLSPSTCYNFGCKAEAFSIDLRSIIPQFRFLCNDANRRAIVIKCSSFFVLIVSLDYKLT
jgi:hypothetical protein